MLTLKVVQAKFGDCLILIFGQKEKPKYMLIDGGPGGIYRDHLRTELTKIKDSGGKLDLVVLSHVDGDHIVGLLDLTEELKENAADGAEPVIEIKELWMNSFAQSISKGNNLKIALQNMLTNVYNLSSTFPSGNLALLSIIQGDTLRRNALLLNIPQNLTSQGEIISYDAVPEPVSMENVKLKIIGPNKENLDKLRKEWHEWIRKNESKIMTTDRELLNQIDRSVPNLSSIMFLLEADGKKMLFTGDGRGDFILEGLQNAGLLDEKGSIHIEIFKVPHHGSIRNTTKDFFKKVTADQYIISGDGRHDNPGFETLSWIVAAAHEEKRKILLVCTNRTGATEKLEKEFPVDKYGYQVQYLSKEDHSLDLILIP
ncbi:MBL fold metallo-hydrolase [soil metagenome]